MPSDRVNLYGVSVSDGFARPIAAGDVVVTEGRQCIGFAGQLVGMVRVLGVVAHRDAPLFHFL